MQDALAAHLAGKPQVAVERQALGRTPERAMPINFLARMHVQVVYAQVVDRDR